MKKKFSGGLRIQKINGLPVADRIRRFSHVQPVKFERPKAVYDNKSREQRIDEILKA